MRWPSLFWSQPAPSPGPDLAATAALAHVEGMRVGTEAERARCAAIMQSAIADHNRPAAEVLAFGTDMDASAAVRLLMAVGNLAEAQNRAGPGADHYVQAARTITERKSKT